MQFILYANLNKMPESAGGNYLPLSRSLGSGAGQPGALCARAGPHMKNGPIRPVASPIEAQEFAQPGAIVVLIWSSGTRRVGERSGKAMLS